MKAGAISTSLNSSEKWSLRTGSKSTGFGKQFYKIWLSKYWLNKSLSLRTDSMKTEYVWNNNLEPGVRKLVSIRAGSIRTGTIRTGSITTGSKRTSSIRASSERTVSMKTDIEISFKVQ